MLDQSIRCSWKLFWDSWKERLSVILFKSQYFQDIKKDTINGLIRNYLLNYRGLMVFLKGKIKNALKSGQMFDHSINGGGSGEHH
jgi:hypothetical protein